MQPPEIERRRLELTAVGNDARPQAQTRAPMPGIFQADATGALVDGNARWQQLFSMDLERARGLEQQALDGRTGGIARGLVQLHAEFDNFLLASAATIKDSSP